MSIVRWEYCVLHVQVVPDDTDVVRWEAEAWVGDESILRKEYTDAVWKQGVIQQLGEMGWELVNVVATETMGSPTMIGRRAKVDQVSVLTFFFKRPIE